MPDLTPTSPRLWWQKNHSHYTLGSSKSPSEWINFNSNFFVIHRSEDAVVTSRLEHSSLRLQKTRNRIAVYALNPKQISSTPVKIFFSSFSLTLLHLELFLHVYISPKLPIHSFNPQIRQIHPLPSLPTPPSRLLLHNHHYLSIYSPPLYSRYCHIKIKRPSLMVKQQINSSIFPIKVTNF